MLKRTRSEKEILRAQTIEELTNQNVAVITEMEHEAERERCFGDTVADTFATIVGSWTFIIIQSFLLAGWVTLNIVGYMRHWDPYPFTFLNLALSFQAAYASPIIMMSQNRQARLSERRNRLDLQINLLAEQENTEMMRMLRMLCEKMGVEIKESVRAMEEQTVPSKVVLQIEKSQNERLATAKAEAAANQRAGK